MHDFKIFKTSGTKIHSDIALLLDSGYQGIHQIHKKSTIPIKRKKKLNLLLKRRNIIEIWHHKELKMRIL